MAGPVVAGDVPNKIKGGRWTVFRFFLVSTAYTSVWLAVSSQLGRYRELFGPQVLLQLNIAYFLPSIPLLVISGLFDKKLEATLGVAKTVLLRLWVGLLGYGAMCAWFPFQPIDIWYLLGSVVALGLFSGIAFSASYQLVSRFANKNVIALGLGCAASGPLVLFLQVAFGVGEEPRRLNDILLYETIAGIVVVGLWATTSLLVRHWDAIENFDKRVPEEAASLEEPLLSQRQDSVLQPGSPRGVPLSPMPSSLPLAPMHMGSLPPALLAYNSLEPFQTFFAGDDALQPHPSPASSASWTEGSLLAALEEETAGGGGQLPGSNGGRQIPRPALSRRNSDPGRFPPWVAGGRGGGEARGQSAGPDGPPQAQGGGRGMLKRQLAQQQAQHPPSMPPPQLEASSGHGAQRPPLPPERPEQQQQRQLLKEAQGKSGNGDASDAQQGQPMPAGAQQAQQALSPPKPRVNFSATPSNMETGSPLPAPSSPTTNGKLKAAVVQRLTWETLQAVWPAVAALGLSGTISLVIFPFFTYIPTSGLLGDLLPKTLFFVRIFADVVGRFLPRLKPLVITEPSLVLALAVAKFACGPLVFMYLKSPEWCHSDVLAVCFIALVWTVGGYINTMANVLAPRLVPPHLKPTAAGLMAITYQTSHFMGLLIATLSALLLYGDIGVE